ncbi:hypothetical protein GGI19_000217 [Coemansia pectinata]|uniref:Uncharacterized protein n=1 Tax=Coemansia pectinata TaxID=1052879 RepID=A0A9W8LCC7_9FUNG|nr:hypothetical protein GGI19_000217 [Coemansia pectinata]
MEPSHSAETQYLIGNAGKDSIKRLMSMKRPQLAIKEFGEQNSLDIPAANTIYGLLDSLGHTRWSIHSTVLESVVVAALKQIQGAPLPSDRHFALLAQLRPCLWISRLRHLPLALLAKQPQLPIPLDIRDTILRTPDLYNACDLSIKRQLWLSDALLFKAHMMPLIRQYVDNPELVEMSREIFCECAKARRERPALADIANSIDSELQLYMQTLGMARELFLETFDTALGTLRLDLAMAMHENNFTEVVNNDVCYKLAWSLDVCVTKKMMDDDGVSDLQDYFDDIDPENTPYGDIALIMSSPYVRHLQAQHILSILEEIAPNAEFSARQADLKQPKTMIAMGLSAHTLILANDAAFPKPDRRVTRTFFPDILRFIETAQARDRLLVISPLTSGGNRSKRPRLDLETPVMGAVESGLEPTLEDLDILASSELARQVIYVFLLKRVDNMDLGMLNLWLPTLTQALPRLLELAADDSATETGEVRLRADTDTANPEPKPLPMSATIAAFEFDAFLQSLITQMKKAGFAVAAAVLNSVDQELSQDCCKIDAIQTPLIKLLDRAGRLRHCGHEQTIVFLAECAHALSAEYSSGNSSIKKKESAVYFIFTMAEHAAAHYAVDPTGVANLKSRYERLAAASPRQAFNYRICKANCPNAAKFLTV